MSRPPSRTWLISLLTSVVDLFRMLRSPDNVGSIRLNLTAHLLHGLSLRKNCGVQNTCVVQYSTLLIKQILLSVLMAVNQTFVRLDSTNEYWSQIVSPLQFSWRNCRLGYFFIPSSNHSVVKQPSYWLVWLPVTIQRSLTYSDTIAILHNLSTQSIFWAAHIGILLVP